MKPEILIERLTSLSEGEMQLFRFLLDKPDGVILTVDTDKLIAELMEKEELVMRFPEDKVIMPSDIRDQYRSIWTDELTLRWRKRNWMYKCLEAGKYLYGVMTWGVLMNMFALRYPHAGLPEVMELFSTTPAFYQWFTERDGRLVLNGFEKNDYYKYLENEIQRDIPFYIPTKEEVEELYEKGCLLSRESHAKLKDHIAENFDCDADTAEIKVHELYEAVNNRKRLNDVVDTFAAGDFEGDKRFAFADDKMQVDFIELYMEMSRECRIRDNRGHDWYEMAAIMAEKNRQTETADLAGGSSSGSVLRRAKIGRNDPCPCGSGKKYKNCCGRN